VANIQVKIGKLSEIRLKIFMDNHVKQLEQI